MGNCMALHQTALQLYIQQGYNNDTTHYTLAMCHLSDPIGTGPNFTLSPFLFFIIVLACV